MPEKPSLEQAADQPLNSSPVPRRQVARWTQEFVRWMPLGGSGWAFFGFVLQSQWMQAIIMLPVTAATGVWAAYSKNFVEQLQEIYADRARTDAKSLVTGMDSLNEALKWQFSGFDAKYLRLQRLDCGEDLPDGAPDDFPPLLQDVFVPLRLSADAVVPGHPCAQPAKDADFAPDRVLLIWDLLKIARQEPAYRKISIRAWGGYGKTTMLKHLAYAYGGREYRKHRAPKLVPFLLYLTACWPKLTQENPLSLPDLLTQYHLAKLPCAEPLIAPPNWALNLLRKGQGLVMFDGFDEVPIAQRAAVSHWLSEQMWKYSESIFIVTSRPAAYKEHYVAQRRPTASYWVENFNDEQQQRFVQQWYLCRERQARPGQKSRAVTQKIEHIANQKAANLLEQLDRRAELKAMAGNALMLNMMARFHRERGGELPQRKVELYQDICELQLVRRPKAKGISLLLSSLSQRQEVLQQVALTMMKRATGAEQEQTFKQIRRDDVLALLTTRLVQRDAEVDAADFLDQIVDVSELLVEKEGGVYEFSHLSFQEFLAALEVQRSQQESWLSAQVGVEAWKPTILLYADMVNPTRLIQAALERNAMDLAYQIWQGTSRRTNLSAAAIRELEALRPQVQASRYAKLEELLKAQAWKDADKETYRLMITAVGKEEGQWFEAEELLNFPCEELLAIDGLWVKYSNGHFGFSVQKAIYVRCGGKLDGKYPGSKVWEKFGDTVGWRMDQEWQNYRDLKVSLSSPQGIFPRIIWGVIVGGCFPSLASRLVNCSTRQS
jgi:GUN4-like/NACHT domain